VTVLAHEFFVSGHRLRLNSFGAITKTSFSARAGKAQEVLTKRQELKSAPCTPSTHWSEPATVPSSAMKASWSDAVDFVGSGACAGVSSAVCDIVGCAVSDGVDSGVGESAGFGVGRPDASRENDIHAQALASSISHCWGPILCGIEHANSASDLR
jgi:hypothetical protein